MSDKIDFENIPPDQLMDETDVSLRAYFTSLGDENLSRYDPN